MKRTPFKGRGLRLVELETLAVEHGQRVSVGDEFVAQRNPPVRYGQETRPGSAFTDRGAPRTNIRDPDPLWKPVAWECDRSRTNTCVGWRERADIPIATRIRFR